MPNYDDQNIFAKILRDEMPCEKVFEDDHTMVIMDIMPWADGHCLVLPKTPARNILDVEKESLAAVMETVRKLSIAVKDAFNADGISVQQNNESAGNQAVFHLHVHVIPRFEGVQMRRGNNQMEAAETLKANADRIRAALAKHTS